MRVIHVDLRFVVLVQVGGSFPSGYPGGVGGGQQRGQNGAAATGPPSSAHCMAATRQAIFAAAGSARG